MALYGPNFQKKWIRVDHYGFGSSFAYLDACKPSNQDRNEDPTGLGKPTSFDWHKHALTEGKFNLLKAASTKDHPRYYPLAEMSHAIGMLDSRRPK